MASELEFKDKDKKLVFTINLGIFAIDKIDELKSIIDAISSPAVVSDVVSKIETLYKGSETTSYTKINDSKGTITAEKEVGNGLDIVENETLASQTDAITAMKDVIDGHVFVLNKKEEKDPDSKVPEKKADIEKEEKKPLKNKSRFDNDPVGTYLKDAKREDPMAKKPIDKTEDPKDMKDKKDESEEEKEESE